MSKTGRSPILRGLLQSDLEGEGYNILNVNAVGDVRQATLYVDSEMPEEIGVRGTGLPFKTFAAAVAAAEPGDLVVLRPGVHAYDGFVDIFHLNNLTILGYGAVIKSDTVVNDTTKLKIRSQDVLVAGIEFDGAVDLDQTHGAADGAIIVQDCANVKLRDLNIHDQSSIGISAAGVFNGLHISHCRVSGCENGIVTDTIGVSANVYGLIITQCNVTLNRFAGIAIVGPLVDSGRILSRIRIENNEISGNAVDAPVDSVAVAAVSVSQGVTGVVISDNYISREPNGIVVAQCQSVIISNNVVRTINQTAIGVYGCQGVDVIGNGLDCQNESGTPYTLKPIVIDGYYSTPYDAGPYVIEGNLIIHVKPSAIGITLAGANDVSIIGNIIESQLNIAEFTYVSIVGNTISVPQTDYGILLNAGQRGWAHCSIMSNRIKSTGASLSRAIATIDATATGGDDLAIIGNVTDLGFTFGVNSYGHSGANAATNVVQTANTPESATRITGGTGGRFDPKYGWVNRMMPEILFNTVVVSQKRGSDSTGIRESDKFPFVTINAAITAATSGDVVLVKDGTFNERMDAKDGITVRFTPSANLYCVSASGCIRSTADSQTFTVYHQHTPMVITGNGGTGISLAHVGCNFTIYGGLTASGNTTYGIVCSEAGTVKVYNGNISTVGRNAIYLSDAATVEVRRGNITTGTTYAIAATAAGTIRVFDSLISGAGTFGVVDIVANAAQHIYSNCTFKQSTASQACIYFSTVGSVIPVFQNCVLVSAFGASESMKAASAQSVFLYGDVIADYGPNPPSNVTFYGPGSYAVVVPIVEVQS